MSRKYFAHGEELAKKNDIPTVPTKISQLDNDSHFILEENTFFKGTQDEWDLLTPEQKSSFYIAIISPSPIEDYHPDIEHLPSYSNGIQFCNNNFIKLYVKKQAPAFSGEIDNYVWYFLTAPNETNYSVFDFGDYNFDENYGLTIRTQTQDENYDQLEESELNFIYDPSGTLLDAEFYSQDEHPRITYEELDDCYEVTVNLLYANTIVEYETSGPNDFVFPEVYIRRDLENE